MASTSKSIPFVVPAQVLPAVEPITQFEFEMYLSLCNQLEQLKAQISTEEEALRARLEAGASVNPGNRVVELKQHLRRAVDWKDVAIRLAVRLKPGVR